MLTIACRQSGISTCPSASGCTGESSSSGWYSPSAAASSTLTRLVSSHAGERLRRRLSRSPGSIGSSMPVGGAGAQFGQRGLAQAALDRQQADRRGARAVVQQLGGAHGRASGRRRQDALPVARKEDRVDQLGLAARELGDEHDRDAIVAQALDHALDARADCGVGQVGRLEPVPVTTDTIDQLASPRPVGGDSLSEIAGSHAQGSSVGGGIGVRMTPRAHRRTTRHPTLARAGSARTGAARRAALRRHANARRHPATRVFSGQVWQRGHQ